MNLLGILLTIVALSFLVIIGATVVKFFLAVVWLVHIILTRLNLVLKNIF